MAVSAWPTTGCAPSTDAGPQVLAQALRPEPQARDAGAAAAGSPGRTEGFGPVAVRCVISSWRPRCASSVCAPGRPGRTRHVPRKWLLRRSEPGSGLRPRIRGTVPVLCRQGDRLSRRPEGSTSSHTSCRAAVGRAVTEPARRRVRGFPPVGRPAGDFLGSRHRPALRRPVAAAARYRTPAGGPRAATDGRADRPGMVSPSSHAGRGLRAKRRSDEAVCGPWAAPPVMASSRA